MRFAHPAQQIVLQDYIHAVQDAEARLDRLTRQIEELLPNWSMAPVVTALQAMRGVALVVAVTVVAEVGDFRRFANARQLMAYLGLVPSEHSSGASVRRSGITKAGNVLARRVLIEGAWTYRMPARVSRKLYDRNEKLSPAIRDIAWKGQIRLCSRYRRLAAAGKPKVVVTTASPVRWSALSGPLPASPSRRCRADQADSVRKALVRALAVETHENWLATSGRARRRRCGKRHDHAQTRPSLAPCSPPSRPLRARLRRWPARRSGQS